MAGKQRVSAPINRTVKGNRGTPVKVAPINRSVTPNRGTKKPPPAPINRSVKPNRGIKGTPAPINRSVGKSGGGATSGMRTFKRDVFGRFDD